MTCSEDGTVRLWDAWNLVQKTVIKPAQERPGRIAVTTCCYSADGAHIAAGLNNGTIQLWDVRGEQLLSGFTTNFFSLFPFSSSPLCRFTTYLSFIVLFFCRVSPSATV